MMNSDQSTNELDRRCSRITRSFFRGLNNAHNSAIRPVEVSQLVPPSEPPKERQTSIKQIDAEKSSKPTRRRSLYYSGKRKKRKSLFIIGDSVYPSSGQMVEHSRVSEASTPSENENQNCVQVAIEPLETETVLVVNQRTTCNGFKRAHSELECEESIISAKRRLRSRLCQQKKHVDSILLEVTAVKRKDFGQSRLELNSETKTFADSTSSTIKQESLSPISSPPPVALLPDEFALPLTPTDSDPCSSPKDALLSLSSSEASPLITLTAKPLSERILPSKVESTINESNSHTFSITTQPSISQQSIATASLSPLLTPPSQSLVYKSVSLSTKRAQSDFNQQKQIFKTEPYESLHKHKQNFQRQDRYFSTPMRISDDTSGVVKSENVPKNWLDVSSILIRSELIVRAIRSDGATKNNQSTKMIFNSLYNQYGKYQDEIAVVNGKNCIKILTNSQQSRMKIKHELEEIFASAYKLDVKLFVGIPELRKPMIYFEFNRRINKHYLMNNIKKWNQWPQSSLISLRSTQYINDDLYRIQVEIDSTIRELIEQNDGKISIDGQKVNVVDSLGLVFCYNCLSYNRCFKLTCYHRKRCCYCDNYHDSECWYKNEPKQWFCFRCKVRGHSIVSKNCPALLIKLRAKLANVDHKYKYVFLEEYNLRNENSRNAMARLF